jgi:hypothetical protein
LIWPHGCTLYVYVSYAGKVYVLPYMYDDRNQGYGLKDAEGVCVGVVVIVVLDVTERVGVDVPEDVALRPNDTEDDGVSDDVGEAVIVAVVEAVLLAVCVEERVDDAVCELEAVCVGVADGAKVGIVYVCTALPLSTCVPTTSPNAFSSCTVAPDRRLLSAVLPGR